MKHIEVITGCMFAGKTTELFNRLKKTNQGYLLVKPIIDNRDKGDKVVTHSGVFESAKRVNRLSDVFSQLNLIKVLGVDEAQFFDQNIITDLNFLKSQQIKVFVAGLEKDYLNKPFGYMQEIINISDSTTRLKATCNSCGQDAVCSHRKNINSNDQLLIGNKNFYQALCLPCYNKLTR